MEPLTTAIIPKKACSECLLPLQLITGRIYIVEEDAVAQGLFRSAQLRERRLKGQTLTTLGQDIDAGWGVVVPPKKINPVRARGQFQASGHNR